MIIKLSNNISCNDNKNDLDIAIRQLYDEYQAFMGCDKLPNFEINYFEHDKNINKIFACVSMPNSKRNYFVLNVCTDYIKLMQYYATPFFYHEFTHILDFETIMTEYNYEERNTLLTAYTEFHATMTELKVATGFLNDIEHKTLYLNSNIMKFTEDITLKKYFESELKNIVDNITQYKGKVDKTNFNNIFNYAIYYMAKMYFAKTYISEINDKLFNFQIFISLLGEDIQFIKDELSPQSNDICSIAKLLKLQNSLINKIDLQTKEQFRY